MGHRLAGAHPVSSKVDQRTFPEVYRDWRYYRWWFANYLRYWRTWY